MFCLPSLLALCLLFPGSARAQRKYNVSHKFNISAAGNAVPQVVAKGQLFGRVENAGAVVQETKPYSHNVPAAGGNLSDELKKGPLNTSESDAKADYAFNPYGVGIPVSGTWTLSGYAWAKGVLPARAVANSTAEVWVQGMRWVKGQKVAYGPTKMQHQSAGTSQSFGRDPWDFSIFDVSDLVNPVLQGTLLDINTNVNLGDLEWDDSSGAMKLTGSGSDYSFSMTASDLLTGGGGVFSYTVQGGVVTALTKSGRFSGLSMPGIGDPGDFSLALDSEFELDPETIENGKYASDQYLFDYTFASEGGASDALVPEPAAYQLAGLLLLGGLGFARRRRPQ